MQNLNIFSIIPGSVVTFKAGSSLKTVQVLFIDFKRELIIYDVNKYNIHIGFHFSYLVGIDNVPGYQYKIL
jgi:hypothetical protein